MTSWILFSEKPHQEKLSSTPEVSVEMISTRLSKGEDNDDETVIIDLNDNNAISETYKELADQEKL